MSKRYDLTGQKFGRLTVIGKSDYNERKKIWWKCKCDCGNEILVPTGSLNSGGKKSCGCLKYDRLMERIDNIHKPKHGDARKRIYFTWTDMIKRCYDNKGKYYYNYGGRGITVCNDWKNDYIAFREWAYNNGYNDDLFIDRIDNDKGYSPENCRFVTRQQNNMNRRGNIDSQCDCKGVTINSSNKYTASITFNGHKRHIGVYETEEEAGNAYDVEAIKLHKEYAYLNFPERFEENSKKESIIADKKLGENTRVKGLLGRKFGRLTVIQESNYRPQMGNRTWICECECGQKILACTSDLTKKNNGIRSCGCLQGDIVREKKCKNLVGKKFGLLTVIGKSEKTNKYGRTFWHCECDCGGHKEVMTSDLNSGSVKSCGCLRKNKNNIS